MRILLVTATLPYPPESGGSIRVQGIAEGLHKAGHEVTLLCFHQGDLSSAPGHIQVESVPPFHRSMKERLRTLLFTRQPDIARRFFSAHFAEKLLALLGTSRYDLIQFEGIEMVCYMPLAKRTQPEARLCFDTFNAEYALQQVIYDIDRVNVRRWHAAAYSRIQVGRIRRFEREMCRLADIVIAVSPEDAALLKGFRSNRTVHVVPNGIWVTDYAKSNSQVATGTNSLVFTGKMDYRPNVDAVLWFAREVLPLITTQVPNIQFYVVGQQPHHRLRILDEIEGIHITGWVDSVLPYLHLATVYVAPLRMGSGTRLKLLGAMAARCPIVATSIASAGLLADAKNGMVIADTPKEMAKGIVNLLTNPETRQTLCAIAYGQVKTNYDWSVLVPRLLAVYSEYGLGD